MTMPNFVIIGAGKAGTTSLYEYLREHPQIYMSPKKEPRFFAVEDEEINFQGPDDSRFRFINRIDDYQKLFSRVSNEIAIGEASPIYLTTPKAPRRIHHHIPNAKIIVILRDPIERAYSNFLDSLSRGIETTDDFAEAMTLEDQRIKNRWSPHWHYKRKGFYFSFLKPYFELFDRENIKVYFFDDLKKNPQAIVKDIYHFLGVDHFFEPDFSIKHNPSGIPRSIRLHTYFLNRIWSKNSKVNRIKNLGLVSDLLQQMESSIFQLNLKEKPKISKDTRKKFIDVYKEDIFNLQELVNRDLSQWLQA